MAASIIRMLVTALTFAYIFPKANGLNFSGSVFPDAFIYSVIYESIGSFIRRFFRRLGALLLLCVTAIGALIPLVPGALLRFSTIVSIVGTIVATPIAIPVWMLGFWLWSVVRLKLCTQLFPANLSVAGWGPAILGGLILVTVNGPWIDRLLGRVQTALTAALATKNNVRRSSDE